MKNSLVLLALLISMSVFSQETFYGTVTTDGYNKISKGAFWTSRPEARLVYLGEYPDNVTVTVLEQQYFVRFANEEHNSQDGNYIVFPAGARVYNKNGVMYAAVCGNKIIFMKPVTSTIIKSEPVVVTPSYQQFVPAKQEFVPTFVSPVKEEKKKKRFNPWAVIIPTLLAVAVGAYFVGNRPAGTVEGGGPGGAN